VRKHLKFTPFPGEPVGWMMEQACAELFMLPTSRIPRAVATRRRSSSAMLDVSAPTSSASTTRTWPSLGPALVPAPARLNSW
jgi:hypothetical protein